MLCDIFAWIRRSFLKELDIGSCDIFAGFEALSTTWTGSQMKMVVCDIFRTFQERKSVTSFWTSVALVGLAGPSISGAHRVTPCPNLEVQFSVESRAASVTSLPRSESKCTSLNCL